MKYQQGDVLIRTAVIPTTGLKPVKGPVLVPSTHPHTISGSDFEVFEMEDESTQKNGVFRYLRTSKPVSLVHATPGHVTIDLPAGEFAVAKRREKGMFDDLVAPVAD